MKQLGGIDDAGTRWLVTVFRDGSGEIACRRDDSETWGVPVLLSPIDGDEA